MWKFRASGLSSRGTCTSSTGRRSANTRGTSKRRPGSSGPGRSGPGRSGPGSSGPDSCGPCRSGSGRSRTGRSSDGRRRLRRPRSSWNGRRGSTTQLITTTDSTTPWTNPSASPRTKTERPSASLSSTHPAINRAANPTTPKSSTDSGILHTLIAHFHLILVNVVFFIDVLF